jgi:hypothetical protein
VTVAAPSDLPLLAPLPFGHTLGEAIVALGGSIAPPPDGVPFVDIGTAPRPRQGAFHIRTLFSGWRDGIVPAQADVSPTLSPVMALAPMLAAALAVNEAFLFVSGQHGIAGRHTAGLSLWDPSSDRDWLGPSADEPEMHLLPSRLWLIGLGHLGQAYLWALGLLPYG